MEKDDEYLGKFVKFSHMEVHIIASFSDVQVRIHDKKNVKQTYKQKNPQSMARVRSWLWLGFMNPD